MTLHVSPRKSRWRTPQSGYLQTGLGDVAQGAVRVCGIHVISDVMLRVVLC